MKKKNSNEELLNSLNKELSTILINFSDYHGDMKKYLDYYKYSAFYTPKPGDPPVNKDLKTNLLKVFADKNIHYISPFPMMKIPSKPNDGENGNIREKILHATHYKSGSAAIQRKNAGFGTLMSAAINEVCMDRKTRQVYVKSLDPRHCYWQMSDQGDGKIGTFWEVRAISKQEAKDTYGVQPTSSGGLPHSVLFEKQLLQLFDGQEWFLLARKLTAKSRTVWIGDRIVEEPHNHQMGGLPVEITMPFDNFDVEHFGAFYLEQLVPLQAEFNKTFMQQSRIARRMANPVVWGRGIVTRQFDDLKKNLERQGGGFAGVGRQGELGLLQVNDVKLLNEHQKAILDNMMRVSGFSSASFGESVGANTSGDALGMYFTPTQRFIEHQNIAWMNHWQSINAKILRAYDLNIKTGEEIKLDGYAPRAAFSSIEGDKSNYRSGAFQVTFTKENIAGNYTNIAIPKAITPKNEIAEKEWAVQAVQQGFISRKSAYESLGYISPEDELALLEEEQLNPALNPEGTQKILEGANQPPTPETAPAGVGANGS